jgi:serine beta-lactamase-like protein LACTB
MEYSDLLNSVFSIPKYNLYTIQDSIKVKKIDKKIKKFVEKHKTVGLAVGITKNGRRIYTGNFGFQDRENRIPITCDKSLFRWASMSKMITAILSIKLCQDQNFDLNANIRSYIPNLNEHKVIVKKCNSVQQIYRVIRDDKVNYIPCLGGFAEYNLSPQEIEKEYGITPNFLLSNRSGICSYDNTRFSACPSDEEMKDPRIYEKEFHHFFKFFIENPYVSLPGEEFNYTTFGFNIMGRILELHSGKKYMQLVDQYIKASNMKKLESLIPDKESYKHLFPNRCKGYSKGKLTDDTDVSFKLPGGGFMSTLDDAIEFCLQISRYSTYEKMMLWGQTDRFSSYGLGFYTWKDDKQNVSVGHPGHQQKASTILKYYPKNDVCFVALSNDEDFSTRKFSKVLNDNINLL